MKKKLIEYVRFFLLRRQKKLEEMQKKEPETWSSEWDIELRNVKAALQDHHNGGTKRVSWKEHANGTDTAIVHLSPLNQVYYLGRFLSPGVGARNYHESLVVDKSHDVLRKIGARPHASLHHKVLKSFLPQSLPHAAWLNRLKIDVLQKRDPKRAGELYYNETLHVYRLPNL